MFDKVASIVIQLFIQLSFLFETKQIQVFIPQFPVLMKSLSTRIISVTSNSLACTLLEFCTFLSFAMKNSSSHLEAHLETLPL